MIDRAGVTHDATLQYNLQNTTTEKDGNGNSAETNKTRFASNSPASSQTSTDKSILTLYLMM